jgi:L-asparagine transporter-like permease
MLKPLQALMAHLQASGRHVVRSASLNAVMVVSVVVMLSFVIAALFIALQQAFGAIMACMVCAVLFGLIAVAIAIAMDRMQKRFELQRAAMQRPAAAMGNPMTVAAGIELARAVGAKRLLPLLALAGLAAVVAAQWGPRDRAAERERAR